MHMCVIRVFPLLPPPRVGRGGGSCDSLRLSVCQQNNSNHSEEIFMKFSGKEQMITCDPDSGGTLTFAWFCGFLRPPTAFLALCKLAAAFVLL